MDKLHEDHKNYVKLLKLMDSLLTGLKQGSDKGYRELYLIMNYMTRYPDIFHHPYEDIIFAELETLEGVDIDEIERVHEMGLTVSDEIERLKAEHSKIYHESRALLDELDAVVNGHIVEKERIQELAQQYTDSLREHMNTEESKIFPMINDRMTEASWDNISDSLKHVNDPIFDGPTSDEYKLIYNQVVNE